MNPSFENIQSEDVQRMSSSTDMTARPTVYSCEICGRIFSYSSSLQKHRLVHTGEKPYTCSICGQSFRQNMHLKRHAKVHTGEKPFTCPLCNKKYTRKDKLQEHIKSIHYA